MISKSQIEQQKQAIEGLYEKVMEAPDSERKEQAVAYCEGCIAACSLALQVMNGTTASAETEKAKAAEPVEEVVETEEKPKRKSSKKKKEEPVEVVEPEVTEPEIEEEDDDLDDLL
ncbi:hypothetical protein [Veillonella sp. VA139]|uniref:hypothetical protein n=1 Tax=Veillonella sp. VA139 TaxID=741830 RepID=UPI000F8E2ECC|nr:hypothetical protein [Veillonella sp. VA139]